MAKNVNENKILRKEYIPIGVAVLVLVILIVALISTIINKPVKKVADNNNNGLVVKEKVVPANSCDAINELTEQVKKIEANYVVRDDIEQGGFFDYDDAEQKEIIDKVYGLELNITNIPDNVELVITSDQDDKVDRFVKTEEKQSYQRILTGIENSYLRVVTIKVYSKLESCSNVELREFEFTLPRWNEAIMMPSCENKTYYDKDFCQPFIFESYDSKSDWTRNKERVEKVNKEIEDKKKQEEDKYKGKIKYIIAGIVIVGITTIVGVISMNKKGRKKNEK